MQILLMSCGRNSGVDQLPLRALAGIEEHAFAVPAQQICVVVSIACGHLTGGTEHDELADGHCNAPEGTRAYSLDRRAPGAA